MSASVFASVVFLKVQEFARRPASEQSRLRAQLEAVVALTTAELAPESRVVLEASDGAAIVVLRDPPGALRIAERALSALAAGLPLCAGVNHGAVQLAGENGARAMAGDGIAVAASAAEFATGASRLLVSRAFRDALADAVPGREAALVRAGVFNDPGLRTHELFRLDPQAPRRRARRHALVALFAAVVLVGSGIGVRVVRDGQEAFVEAMVLKYRSTAQQGETYWRALLRRVRYP